MSDETERGAIAAVLAHVTDGGPHTFCLDDEVEVLTRDELAQRILTALRGSEFAPGPEIVGGMFARQLPPGTRVTTVDHEGRPVPNGGTWEILEGPCAVEFNPAVRFLVSRVPKRPLTVNDVIDTAEKLDRLPRGAVIGALDLVAWRGPHQWYCSDEQTPADPREHLVAMIEQGGAEMRLLGLLRSP